MKTHQPSPISPIHIGHHILVSLGFLLGVLFLFLLHLPARALEPLPASPPIPKNNPITKEKIELGKMLYFEPRLSKSGTISCNSCHNVMSAGEDGRPVSIGIEGQKGNRSAPTVWNAAFLSVQFWDGRAPSLEEQAKGPIQNPVEMGASHALVIDRLQQIEEYKIRFAKAFGNNPAPVNIDHVAKAIATYERTLITPRAPFDQYLKGNRKAMTKEQVEGLQKFQSVGCISCHSGPHFAGPLLPEGSGFFMKFPTFPGSQYETQYKLTEDKGRFEVTRQENDKNMWRVPSLRNVALTAPYFHNGRVKTLDEAVRVMAKTQLNQNLSETDVKLIVAFLKSLTGEFPQQKMPRLPPTLGFSQVGHE